MYDVIVVGARCAGSPTAMLLARKRYRVLLVDKALFPSDVVNGYGRFAQRQRASMGVTGDDLFHGLHAVLHAQSETQLSGWDARRKVAPAAYTHAPAG
jgi:flavin-dependent dehydrogenase